jgi:class 3 adenylate cyclase
VSNVELTWANEPAAILFAATYPERTRALTVYGSLPRFTRAAGFAFGPTREMAIQEDEDDARRWGTVELAREMLGGGVEDDELQAFAARMRQSASPGRRSATRSDESRDRRPRRPDVDSRTDARTSSGLRPRPRGRRTMDGGADPTDIVGSTAKAAELGDRGWRELLELHHAAIRRELARFRGSEIDTADDGFFARFDGPAGGIRCAAAITKSLQELGIQVRAGLHTGDCELVDNKVAGIAVSIGARVAAQARPGEVLVSQTLSDLVAGSGLAFEDRVAAELKGVPGEWRFYAVADAGA